MFGVSGIGSGYKTLHVDRACPEAGKEILMLEKKQPVEKHILTIIFSSIVICGVLLIIFPQLRLFCLNFSTAKYQISMMLIFTLAISGILMSGLFLFILYYENTLFAFLRKNYFIAAYAALSFIAICIRIAGFKYVSPDYKAFIINWTEYLSQNGHFFGIATIKSDYSPVYLYFLSIVSFFPKNLWLPCVKIISCIFDFLLAFVIAKSVFHVHKNKFRALTAYAMILFCPTVFFNSGIWAQCESIYALFVFLSLLYFIKNKVAWALFFCGIALSIKIQTIFVIPFIIFLYFGRCFSFNKLLYFFLGFISTIIIGLPFGAHIQMLKAYFKQLAGYSDRLTMNAPSVYALFNAVDHTDLLGRIGIVFTFTILFGMLLLIIKNHEYKAPEYNSKQTAVMRITLFFFSVLIVPFFLPRMHERYFYLAEIASILYAFIIPQRWYIPLLIILPSCAGYFNFLFMNNAGLFPRALIVMAAVILVILFTIKNILQYYSKPHRPFR
ncbi:MAG: hypothetical protein LBC77_03420 [Spirochaetaceae bacterium]|nr:hypothetical protein [Spirochaetaceae bacterium]